MSPRKSPRTLETLVETPSNEAWSPTLPRDYPTPPILMEIVNGKRSWILVMILVMISVEEKGRLHPHALLMEQGHN